MAVAKSLDELAATFAQAAPDSAALAGLADDVQALLKHWPTTAFAYPAAQAALRRVEARLVELGRGAPDRFTGATTAWLATREAK